MSCHQKAGQGRERQSSSAKTLFFYSGKLSIFLQCLCNFSLSIISVYRVLFKLKRKHICTCLMHLQFMQDEERGSLTDLESFADSNGEQCSEERHPSKDYSLRDLQYPGEMNTWPKSRNVDPHLDHLSGRTILKERDTFSVDYITRLPSPVYNFGSSYLDDSFSERDILSVDYIARLPSPVYNFDTSYPDDSSSPDTSPLLFEKVRDCTDAILLTDDSSSLDASPSFSFL